mgnify:FL=1
MAIKLTGQVLLATATTNVANNQPTMTYRFRFLLDPACAAPANSGRLFRFEFDSGFNFMFEGSASPDATVVTIGGQGGVNVRATIPFSLGTPMHVVACWDQPHAKQTIWVNGIPAAQATHNVNTAGQNSKIHVGAATQSATTLVTLNDLLILNTSVTDADVIADLDRTTTLEAAFPGNVRWHPSLTGTEGSPVALGDPGLVDDGSLNKDLINLSGTGQATWSGEACDFAPAVLYDGHFVCQSGELIKFALADTAGNPMLVTKVSQNPTISVNGGAPQALSRPITTETGQNNKTPWVMYPLPVPVLAGDVVTCSAPYGWAQGAPGGAPALENVTLANKVGQLCYDVPTPGTLKLGLGVDRQNYFYMIKPYKNLLRGGGWGNVTMGPEGKPIAITGGSGSGFCNICNSTTGNGLDTLGMPVPTAIPWAEHNPNFYTLVWDEAAPANDSNFRLRTGGDSAGSATCTITERLDLAENPASGLRRKRVYEITRKPNPPSYNLNLYVYFSRADWTTAECYGPGEEIDPENEVSDIFKSYLEGASVVRFMDFFDTNGSNVAFPEDLLEESQFNWVQTKTRTIPFTKIEPVAPGELTKYQSVGSNNYVVMKVTTSEPHGFVNGRTFGFEACTPDLCTSQDGSTFTLNDRGGSIRVLSPTSFEAFVYSSQVAGLQTVQSAPQLYTGSSHLTLKVIAYSPVEFACDTCNALDAGLWLNVCHAMQDETFLALARRVVARLRPGLPVLLEFSNEVWNFAQSFWAQWVACSVSAYQAGYGYDGFKWAFRRGMDAKTIFQSVFAETGRESEVKLVLSGRDGTLNFDSYASWLQDQGIVGEYVMTAAYRDFPTAWIEASEGLSVSGHHDIWQAMVTSCSPRYTSEPEGWFPRQRAAVKAVFPDAELVLYEGAVPQSAYCQDHTNYGPRTRDFFYHPRQYDTFQLFCASLQEAGVVLYCPYLLALDAGWFDKQKTWSHYLWHGQDRGYGDGSDGKANNLECQAISKSATEHQDFANVSVWGQAWSDWAIAAGSSTPPLPPAVSVFYREGKKNLWKGVIDLETDVIKALLVEDSYQPAESSPHEFRTDVPGEISGPGYTAGGVTLTGKQVTVDAGTHQAVFSADIPSWSNASFSAAGLVLYRDTGDPATSPLIGYLGLGGVHTSTGGTVLLRWHDLGIARY